LARYPHCQICAKRRSYDIHHTAGREGPMLLNHRYWMAVCRPCHTRVHENPAWAREKGYLGIVLRDEQIGDLPYALIDLIP
jgi:hypothetical protein